MSENLRSEGIRVTLENVTAASNIAAGQLVGVSGHTVYTLDSGTTGLGNTATLGYRFIGILDDAVSGGESPVTVITDGVFELQLSSGAISGNLYCGLPVGWESGRVHTPGAQGDASIGTLVGMSTWGSTAVGYVQVKIRPMALNMTIFAAAALSATAPLPGAFPELATR